MRSWNQNQNRFCPTVLVQCVLGTRTRTVFRSFVLHISSSVRSFVSHLLNFVTPFVRSSNSLPLGRKHALVVCQPLPTLFSKQRAVVKSLVTRTLRGDARAASLLTSLMMRLLETGEGAPVVAEPLFEEERGILGAFEERVKRGLGHETTAPDGSSDAAEETS